MTQPMQDAGIAARIVCAAEALFAQRGFIDTSLRQITAQAEVNLAAVNYHFGSRQGLIEAVALRFVEPLCQRLEALLTERAAVTDARPEVEELLEMLVRALLQVKDCNEHALALFMRLLDLAYLPSQEGLRDFLRQQFGGRFEPFVSMIRLDSTPMHDNEFFWRLHFLLGSLVFTLSNYDTLSQLEQEAGYQSPEVERILHRMILVLSAGFQARAERPWLCRV